MAAKFLVTAAPGAPIAGVGFVRPGEIFTAPSDYVPSFTMKPVNTEAVDALKKVQKSLLERAKTLRDAAKDPVVDNDERKISRQHAAALEANAKSIDLQLFEKPSDDPKIEQGIPLSKLAEKDREPAPPGEDRKL